MGKGSWKGLQSKTVGVAMADPLGLRCQRNTRMLNPAPKNVGGRVPKPSLILTLSPQGCDKGRGLYRWPETTNIYIWYHAGLMPGWEKTLDDLDKKVTSFI